MSKRIRDAESALKHDTENYALWLERGMGLIYDPVDKYDVFITDDERAEEARLSMCMGLRYNPFSADCHHRRGRKLVSLGRFVEAVADISMASRLDRENPDHWYYQGVAAYLAEIYDLAAECSEKACELMKKNNIIEWIAPIKWAWLAYTMQGKHSEAKRVAMEVNHDTPVVDRSITYKRRLLLYTGQIPPEEFLDRKRLLTTDRPELYLIDELYALGNYYYLHGDIKRSNELLLEARTCKSYRQCFAYLLTCRDLAKRGL